MKATALLSVLALLAAILVGAWLRTARLSDQLIGDDEVHLLRASLNGRFPEILYTYDSRDFSAPMATVARSWLVASGRLPVAALRLFPWITGIGLLVIGAAWGRRFLTPPALLAWIAALATSPWLIAYSRIARSYSAVVLLSLVSCALLVRWRESRGRTAGFLLAAVLAVGVWFHPLAIAIAIGTYTFTLVSALRESSPRSRRDLWLSIATFLVLCGLFLIPGRASLILAMARRVGKRHVSLQALAEAAKLLCGTTSGALTAAMIACAVGVAIVAVRRGSIVARTLTAQSTCLLLLVLGSSPSGAADPLPLARYLLPLTPWILLGSAIAFDRVLQASSRLGLRLLVTTVMFCWPLTPYFWGPLPLQELRFTSFMHHPQFLRFTRELPNLERIPLARSYALLSGREGAVIEFPWWYVWKSAAVSLHAQRVHRRPVIASVPDGPLSNSQFFARTNLPPRPARWLESNAKWLVVHRDLIGEELALANLLDPGRSTSRFDARFQSSFLAQSELLISNLTAQWGYPDLEDDQVLAWDLDRVRIGQAQAKSLAQ